MINPAIVTLLVDPVRKGNCLFQALSYPQLFAGSSCLLALPGVGQHRCCLYDAYGVFCALTFTGPDYVSINDYLFKLHFLNKSGYEPVHIASLVQLW